MAFGTSAQEWTGGQRGQPHCRPRRAAAVFALLALGLLADARCQAPALTDAQLRARFVRNFVRFSEWPDRTFDAPDAPLMVCVLGAGEAVDSAFAALDGTTAGSHRIVVRAGVAPENAAQCHLLFAPDSELRSLPMALEAIGRRAVLVVGESPAALDRGAMIALRTVDRRLEFVVRMSAARSCRLNFSPQMLQAAAEVLP